jgi:SAM-dependent methyltransferase
VVRQPLPLKPAPHHGAIAMNCCRLCNTPMRELFAARDYRRPDDLVERVVLWCDACSYGCVRGSWTPTEVKEFYDVPNYYTHGTASRQEPPSKRESFLDRLRVHLAWRNDFGSDLGPAELEYGKKVTNPELCDLGCGSGRQLSAFATSGYMVIGVDPDPEARAVAKDIAYVLDGTAEELPLEVKKRQFDVVLLSHVLEHCIDPVRALQNAKDILAPGGTVVIEVPNNAALGFVKFQAAWPWADVPRHLHFFTEQSLTGIMQHVGLQVTRRIYVGYTRQFQTEWISTQHQIWTRLKGRPAPNFSRAAWLLLFRTALASSKQKYDSIRIHACA